MVCIGEGDRSMYFFFVKVIFKEMDFFLVFLGEGRDECLELELVVLEIESFGFFVRRFLCYEVFVCIFFF